MYVGTHNHLFIINWPYNVGRLNCNIIHCYYLSVNLLKDYRYLYIHYISFTYTVIKPHLDVQLQIKFTIKKQYSQKAAYLQLNDRKKERSRSRKCLTLKGENWSLNWFEEGIQRTNYKKKRFARDLSHGGTTSAV
jgi:hypothetical protein